MVHNINPDRPLRTTSAPKLLALAGGRPDVRRKPLDPRIQEAAELEIVIRKAQGEWRMAA